MSVFIWNGYNSNNASLGRGDALLVGGTNGFSGGTPFGMNNAYLSVTSSSGSNNIDQTGTNNVAVLDLTGLGNSDNDVKFVTDGSFS